MAIERTTIEEMRCSMGGCPNTVRDLGMREGEGVYTIEEIAIDAGWKIEELNGGVIHVCPRCSSDYDALRAELARVKAESLRVVVVPDEGNLYDWYMTPTGLGYPGKDRKQNNCIESAKGYHRIDECKPVRLERWEDE